MPDSGHRRTTYFAERSFPDDVKARRSSATGWIPRFALTPRVATRRLRPSAQVRTSVAAMMRVATRAPRRWYNPLHIAKLKPHEMRGGWRKGPPAKPADAGAGVAAAAAPAEVASRAPAQQPGAGGATGRHDPSEGMTLADLIRMQASDVAPSLPKKFIEHASAVRTYDGSRAKTRAESGEEVPRASANMDDAGWWRSLPDLQPARHRQSAAGTPASSTARRAGEA